MADENPDILSDKTFTKWKPKPNQQIIESTYNALMEAWLLGLRFYKNKDNYDFADISLSFDLKYDDAIKIAGSRKVVTPANYKKLSSYIKQQAFTVGRLAQLDMVNKAKDVYLKAIDADKVGDIGSFIKDMATVDPKASGLPGYYQMVYRTNIQSDYNAAKAWALQEDPPEFLQFVAIEDERTSNICSARAGVTLPYTDTFWDSNWPPLHYNCRSTVRSVDAKEAEAMGIVVNGKAKVTRPSSIEKPQGTFGMRPTKDNAFWGSSPSQHARIAADMIEDEINEVAGQTVCKDFSKPKEGYTYVDVTKGGLRYKDSLKNALEFDDNISASKTLSEVKGYYIELNNAKKLRWNNSCDGWINGVEKLEIKTLTSTNSRNIKNIIEYGFEQADIVAVSIKPDNIDNVRNAIKRMAGTIKTRRPNAKSLIVIVEDKVTDLQVSDFQDVDNLLT